MDGSASPWETWIEVSIQSIQLNVAPVAISDISVLETHVLLRKMLVVPRSK